MLVKIRLSSLSITIFCSVIFLVLGVEIQSTALAASPDYLCAEDAEIISAGQRYEEEGQEPLRPATSTTSSATNTGPSTPGTGGDGVSVTGAHTDTIGGVTTSGGGINPTTQSESPATPSIPAITIITPSTPGSAGTMVIIHTASGAMPAAPTTPAAPVPIKGPGNGGKGGSNGGPVTGGGCDGAIQNEAECKASQPNKVCTFTAGQPNPVTNLNACTCSCVDRTIIGDPPHVEPEPDPPVTGSITKPFSDSAKAQWRVLNGGQTQGQAPGQGESESTEQNLLRSDRGGVKFMLASTSPSTAANYPFRFPFTMMDYLGSAVGEELQVYWATGNLGNFKQVSVSSGTYEFILTWVKDSWGNKTEYFYNTAGAVSEVRVLGTKTTYTYTPASSGGRIIEVRKEACGLDYTGCQDIGSVETYRYDSANRLVRYELSDTEYVDTPSAGSLYNLNVSRGRGAYLLSYGAHGHLERKEYQAPNGALRALFQIEWEPHSSNLWRVRKVIDAAGFTQTFIYGTNTITVDDGYKSSAYLFNAAGLVVGLTIVPHTNDGFINLPAQTWSSEYLIPDDAACPIKKKSTYPTGAVWEGLYDTWFRLIKSTTTSPKSDNETVSESFIYGPPLEGSPLYAVYRGGAWQETFYSWEKILTGDLRFRPTRIWREEKFTRADGIGDKNSFSTYFNFLGQKVKEIQDGIVTEYKYLAKAQRRLLKEIYVGADNGVGVVDINDLKTSRSAVEREWPSGRVIKSIDGYGNARSTTTTFYIDGLPKEIIAGSSRTRLFYTAFGELASMHEWVRGSDGQKKRDLNGQAIGADWIRTDYFYDSIGQLTSSATDIDRPGFAPSDWSSLSSFQKINYSYYPYGRVKDISSALGGIHYDYNALFGDWKTSLIGGPLLSERIASLTSEQFRSLVGDNKYTTSSVNYSKAGTVKKVTDSAGIVTEPFYSQIGELLRVKQSKAGTVLSHVKINYDELSRPIAIYDLHPSTGLSTQVAKTIWGKFGVLEQFGQFAQSGPLVKNVYDEIGRLVSESSSGLTTQYSYAPHDSLVAEVAEGSMAETYRTQYEYDQNKLVSKILFLGTTNTPKITEFKYDSLGNKDWERGVDGVVSTQSVRANGFSDWLKRGDLVLAQATRVINSGKIHASVKDIFGQVLKVVHGQAGVESVEGPMGQYKYSYDTAANLLKASGPLRSSSYKRDAIGRISEVAFTGSSLPTVTKRFSYDNFSRLVGVSIEDISGKTETKHTLDEYSRVVASALTLPSGAVKRTSYSFIDQSGINDLSGRMYEATLEGIGSFRREYDQVSGRVTATIFGGAVPGVPAMFSNYEYDGGFKPTAVNLPSQRRIETEYDGYGMLSKTKVFMGSQLQEESNYVRDNAGRVTQLQRITGAPVGAGSAVKYDPVLGRVLKVGELRSASDYGKDYDQIASFNRETIYTYDQSNPFVRTEVRTSGTINSSKSYTVNSSTGRISAVNGNPINYDDEGLMVDTGARQYVWDAAGRLSQVQDSTGNTLQTFGYDTEGKLISEGTNEIKRYIGSQEIALEDNSGAKAIYDVHPYVLDEKLVSYLRSSNGSMQGYETSYSLGSPANTYQGPSLIEGNAFVNLERKIYPAGSSIAQSGSTIGLEASMHGLPMDSNSGLVYAKARFLDPILGLFISWDPIIKGAHLLDYGYTLGDHVNNSDKTGTQQQSLGSFSDSIRDQTLQHDLSNQERIQDTYGQNSCMNCHDYYLWSAYTSAGLCSLGRETFVGSSGLRFTEQLIGKTFAGGALAIGTVTGLTELAAVAPIAASAANYGLLGVGTYGTCCLAEDICKNGPSAENMSSVAAMVVITGAASTGGLNASTKAPPAASTPGPSAAQTAALSETVAMPKWVSCKTCEELPKMLSSWPAKPLPKGPSDYTFPSPSGDKIFLHSKGFKRFIQDYPTVPSNPKVVDFGNARGRYWVQIEVEGRRLFFYRSSGAAGSPALEKRPGEWCITGGTASAKVKGKYHDDWLIKSVHSLAATKSPTGWLRYYRYLLTDAKNDNPSYLLKERSDFHNFAQWLENNLK